MKRKHKDLRHGQFIYNFMAWLHCKKNYPRNPLIGESLMADPFHISDKDYEKLEREFVKGLKGRISAPPTP